MLCPAAPPHGWQVHPFLGHQIQLEDRGQLMAIAIHPTKDDNVALRLNVPDPQSVVLRHRQQQVRILHRVDRTCVVIVNVQDPQSVVLTHTEQQVRIRQDPKE